MVDAKITNVRDTLIVIFANSLAPCCVRNIRSVNDATVTLNQVTATRFVYQ